MIPADVAARAGTRLHALDAIRASALLLGICLHASLSLVPTRGLVFWPVSDVQQSTALTVAGFVIHIFRMSVFFLVAGLLARALVESRGVVAFLRNRAARILVPLVLGWVLCFALLVGVGLWLLAKANNGELPSPLPTAMLDAGLNFLHLWFLYLLLWLYAISLAMRSALLCIDKSGSVSRMLDATVAHCISSRAGPLALAAPVVVALSVIPNWSIGMGVPTPAYTLVPPATSLSIYLYVFVLGWAMHRQLHLLAELAKRWSVNFCFGLIGALFSLHLAAAQPDPASVLSGAYHLLGAAAYGIALVCLTFAFVGLGCRYFSQESPVVRYLADASYWMYIIHLPLVMALQTALMYEDLHWSIKFLLINALGAGLLLLTYHCGVRYTWVGRLLNGARRPRRTGLVHTKAAAL